MAVPTVTAVNPGSGPPGTRVIVSGTEFTNDTIAVKFGSTSAGRRFTVISSTRLLVFAPAGTGTQKVTVQTPGGTSTENVYFTYAADEGPPGGGGGSAPTVSDLSIHTSADQFGQGGDTVTVTGTGFTTALAVYFGEAQAGGISIVSDTSLTCISPPGSGTVDVDVENSYGRSAEPGDPTANNFTYPLVAVPVVTSIAPSVGFWGDHVTITGSGFTYATEVLFGTLLAPFLISSDTSIVADVPNGTPGTTVDVLVANYGGTASDPGAGNNFTYGSGRLLRTTATNVELTPYANWRSGPVSVSMSAVDTGGPGVEAIYYRLNGGAITKYTGAFNVTPAGCNQIEYWAVALDGLIEPSHTGFVNIVTTSDVPAALSLTPGMGFIFAKWTKIVKERPVSYKVYADGSNPPTTLVGELSANVLSIKRTKTDGLTYVAVSSVDYNGTESAKCTAVSATALGVVGGDIPDNIITAGMLVAGTITASSACITSLNADWITAGTIDCDLLSGGTILGQTISGGTITGANVNVTGKLSLSSGGIIELAAAGTGVIRTAASGQRIELSAASIDTLKFYSGSAVETQPGGIQVWGDSSQAYTLFTGPVVDGRQPMLYMLAVDNGGAGNGTSEAQLYADKLIIGSGSIGDSYAASTTMLSGAVTSGPSRRAGVKREWDFMDAAANYNHTSAVDEWYVARHDANGYTQAAVSATEAHPGAMAFTSAAAYASGCYMRTALTAIALNTNATNPYDFDYCEFVFKVPTTTNARVRMGFINMFDSVAWTSGDYGALLDVNGTTVTGKVIINGTAYDTGTTTTITANTWYTGRIKVHDGNHTEFRVYNADGTEKWAPTDIAYAPTGQALGHGWSFWTGGSSAQNHWTIDYMNYFLAPRSR